MSNVHNPSSSMQEDSTTGKPVAQKSTAGAALQRLKASEVADGSLARVSEQIYSGTAVGNQITTVSEDCTDWTFHVLGVDADDDVTIQVSFDGTNYVKIGLVNVEAGTFINQTSANVEAAGAYKPGVATNIITSKLSFKSVKVVRETAAGSNAVTVWATGRN